MRKLAVQVVALAPNATAGFTLARASLRMTCLSGGLWVTCDGDPRDHLLTPGQHFAPSSQGRLVVQAMPTWPARFLLQRSEDYALASRRPMPRSR